MQNADTEANEQHHPDWTTEQRDFVNEQEKRQQRTVHIINLLTETKTTKMKTKTKLKLETYFQKKNQIIHENKNHTGGHWHDVYSDNMTDQKITNYW